MNIPEQCEKCILLNICLEDRCIKTDPCRNKIGEDVKVDPDLLMEMKERMGI